MDEVRGYTMLRRCWLLLLVAVVALDSLTACGGSAATILPDSAAVPPLASQDFAATGGSPPFSWSLSENASGGSVDASGHYRAGATGNVSDVLLATDAAGRSATATITVGAGLAISPPTVSTWQFGRTSFTAAGGSGAGYVFALKANASGATVDDGGHYAAGGVGGGEDVVSATDALGNTATATVHVRGQLVISPTFSSASPGEALRFSATGGTGALAWSLATRESGGSLDAAGNYLAGSLGGIDVIKVTDAAGDEGVAAVRVDAPPSNGFQIARHNEETLPFQGGPILEQPVWVTITWANDKHRKDLEALGEYLMHSNWLAEVGAEYGVTSGGHVNVELSTNAPSTISDDDVQANIAAGIADGSLPANPNAQNIYAYYLPATTRVTFAGQDLCKFSGGGYHSEATTADGKPFAYAVISPCASGSSSTLTNLEITTSHELIEACTDPFPGTAPGYRMGQSTSNPWSQVGGEIGDMCAYAPTIKVDGYTLVPAFSNAASAAGRPPCVPTAGDYFNVSASPTTMQFVTAGQSVTFTLTGWSATKLSSWQIYASQYGAECCRAFNPTLDLGSSTLNNGETTTLKVGVPLGTPSQSGSLVYIGSYFNQQSVIADVVGVIVK